MIFLAKFRPYTWLRIMPVFLFSLGKLMAAKYHALCAKFSHERVSESHVLENDSRQREDCFWLPGCDSVQPVRELLTFRTNLLSQYFTLYKEEGSSTEASENVYHYIWTFQHLKMRPLGCRNVRYQPFRDASASSRRTESSGAQLRDPTHCT